MSPLADEIKADPELRRRIQIVAAGFLLAGLAGVWWAVSSGFSLEAAVEQALKDGSAAELRQVLLSSILFAVALGGAIGAVLIILGMRLWRADQWPSPGTRVYRDTHVLRGPKLRSAAAMLVIMGIVSLGLAVNLCRFIPVAGSFGVACCVQSG